MPIKKIDDVANRTRTERVAFAIAQIESSTEDLKNALDNIAATGIVNPVLEELREAIVLGRRMNARAHEILKRIP